VGNVAFFSDSNCTHEVAVPENGGWEASDIEACQNCRVATRNYGSTGDCPLCPLCNSWNDYQGTWQSHGCLNAFHNVTGWWRPGCHICKPNEVFLAVKFTAAVHVGCIGGDHDFGDLPSPWSIYYAQYPDAWVLAANLTRLVL
jgi:hypothetical protein